MTTITPISKAMQKLLDAGTPITKTIQKASTDFPDASRADIIAAGEAIGLKATTCNINFLVARKGSTPPKPKKQAVSKPTKPAKHDPDLPPVGSRIKFVDTSGTAKSEGRMGKVVEGTVTKLRGREIIVQPDCANRPTWIYKSNLR